VRPEGLGIASEVGDVCEEQVDMFEGDMGVDAPGEGCEIEGVGPEKPLMCTSG
jgi:hypothetical protein